MQAVTFLPLVLAVSALAQAPARWTPELSMQVRHIGEVAPSPDGSLAAYTQAWVLMEGEASRWVTEIFLARYDGSDRKSTRLNSSH